jgi:hypothetical protein
LLVDCIFGDTPSLSLIVVNVMSELEVMNRKYGYFTHICTIYEKEVGFFVCLFGRLGLVFFCFVFVFLFFLLSFFSIDHIFVRRSFQND